jgi:hypothetical protein
VPRHPSAPCRLPLRNGFVVSVLVQKTRFMFSVLRTSGAVYERRHEKPGSREFGTSRHGRMIPGGGFFCATLGAKPMNAAGRKRRREAAA